MKLQPSTRPMIAIACGGTGGHLFPGIAVGEELVRCNCDVTLLVSPKDVDQQAVKAVRDMEIVTLPAVGLTGKNVFKFAAGCWRSYRQTLALFKRRPPCAVLAMGGFTGAPPVFAGKRFGARTFLHESNSIPGKANRWLARFVDEAFVYFAEAADRMKSRSSQIVGMPVRSCFLESVDSQAARMALGLAAGKPVLLVMGGSQGASGINELVLKCVPLLARQLPDLQFLHLTGPRDFDQVQQFYRAENCKAVVRPFMSEMDLALGAATAAISRAGASSIAEIAAMRLPTVFIPYPHATDNHQFHNASGVVCSGAGRVLDQHADPEALVAEVVDLVSNDNVRTQIQSALEQWRTADAAQKIAIRILAAVQPSVVAANAGKRWEEPNPREGGCQLRKEANA